MSRIRKEKTQEKRRYIRTSTVLPVEFVVLDSQGKKATPWLQGFTRDIGKGGIQLRVNDLWWGFWDRFSYRNARLFVKIDLPFKKKSISAPVKVAWSVVKKDADYNQCVVGLEFLEGAVKETQLLFKYAVFKKALPVFVSGLVLALFFFSSFSFWKSQSLARENRRLVNEYVATLEKSSQLEGVLKSGEQIGTFFEQRQKVLREKISFLENELLRWQQKYKESIQEEEKEDDSQKKLIRRFRKEIAALIKENNFLKEKQKERREINSSIRRQVKRLEVENRKSLQKIIAGMYGWIKNRQDLAAGLVLSYEGDRNLDKVYFTYDQALAVVSFLLFEDTRRAEKVLDFYLEKVKRGERIYNAYSGGGGVFEYTVHSGPNAWIGLAALNYTKKTGNEKYLPVAESVSDMLLSMMDKEGGVKGGPAVNWYATEHNLDAFAFFDLFYRTTRDEKYLRATEKLKEWIYKYAYTTYGPPVKRGKGDSTIATDTYAWSITAFGPQVLASLEMDSDTILDFAVRNCEVAVKFKRNGDEVDVKGFDFAKHRNIARGGVVSGEWTSQMVLAFKVMADYYKDKDVDKHRDYLEKSEFYLQELQKMLITSPSRIGKQDPCLPYASLPSVDTGHGWRTPKGNKTGSLASTAYFLIAYKGYNPLKGEHLELSLKNVGEERVGNITSKVN
ncbi:MAG: PilZ domain-containing protein [Candidatus Omnitrophota bacterium]|nr:MAG: PilZ domain-containing protein [Candidatus Omnitrophota bacterium]